MNVLTALCSLTLVSSTASAQTQSEVFRFEPTGANARDFGSSVATDGLLAVICDPRDTTFGVNSGAIYLHDLESGQEIARIFEPSPGTNRQFGYSAALQGNLALIGSYGGGAYVYDAMTGQLLMELVPSIPGGNFGVSVDFDGNRAIVGAPGSASAFVFDMTTGQQLARLTGSSAGTADWFAYDVAIHGDRAIVGASRDDIYNFSSGSAFLFDLNTMQEIARLIPDTGENGDYFGTGVGINSTSAWVGAPLWDTSGNNNVGRVFTFDLVTGQLTGTVLNPSPTLGDRFGWNIDMTDTHVAIGAPITFVGHQVAGTAYLYDALTEQLVTRFLPTTNAADQYFGWDVALSETTAIIGANGVNYGNVQLPGVAYRFTVPDGSAGTGFCQGGGQGQACPCANGALDAGCENSAGLGGARLQGMGGASLSDDWFALHVTNVPANKPGLILRGANTVNGGMGNPAGEGLLCVTGQSARSQVEVTTGNVVTFSDFQGAPFGMSSYGAGVPTNYQFWYRDPQGSCNGSGFNFSNAWATVWLP